jgi:hypothetical protein
MRLAITALAALAVVCTAAPAHASASFPAEVDKYLKLTAPIESFIPPQGQGCRLCHSSDTGGYNTNNTFGTMMKNAGTMGTVTGSVDIGLAKLTQTAPRAIMDIQSMMNPNDDPLALNNDPIPAYGCGSIAGVRPPESARMAPLLALGALSLFLLRRRTASGRRADPRIT